MILLAGPCFEEWTLSNPNGLIFIEFTEFQLEAHASCRYDWVQIIDGDGTTLLPKSCGGTVPAAIISKTGEAIVKFHSDYSVVRKGFRLQYSYKGKYSMVAT